MGPYITGTQRGLVSIQTHTEDESLIVQIRTQRGWVPICTHGIDYIIGMTRVATRTHMLTYWADLSSLRIASPWERRPK